MCEYVGVRDCVWYILYSGKVWWGECLANLLFFKCLVEKSSVNEWISQLLLWMVLVWRIADDSPNLTNSLPAKFSRYMVHLYSVHLYIRSYDVDTYSVPAHYCMGKSSNFKETQFLCK